METPPEDVAAAVGAVPASLFEYPIIWRSRFRLALVTRPAGKRRLRPRSRPPATPLRMAPGWSPPTRLVIDCRQDAFDGNSVAGIVEESMTTAVAGDQAVRVQVERAPLRIHGSGWKDQAGPIQSGDQTRVLKEPIRLMGENAWSVVTLR